MFCLIDLDQVAKQPHIYNGICIDAD
jgi:hypothetical protein